MNWIIREYETGGTIAEFDTYKEALKEFERFEQDDIDEGIYTPDFYEIVKVTNEI